MASLLSIHPHPVLLSPLPRRSRALNPIPLRSRFGFCAEIPSSVLRFDSVVARLGPIGEFPDLESFEDLAHKLLDRAESIIYTIADAAIASSPDAAAVEGSKRSGDWLSGITGYLEAVLKILKDGLSVLHVPYAYGFAIILLTVIVKAATFPLTKKQIESTLAMRSLQPQVKAIQQLYAGDAERIQLETARLYKLASVNPLAGCLPTLATIPVWIGLYRALSNVADEGLLTEGFFWIPSLAGPITIASRQSGSGTSWLFPFVDGHPPLGWSETLAYLVLPLLLVGSQYISAQIMQSSQGSDPSQKNAQAVTKLLPLMIGYFALSVPSGLSLYWFTNNVLSTAQQIWLQKLGGANKPVQQYGDMPTKDESSNIQNSVSNVEKSVIGIETEKVQTSQGEKADSSGLLPGERFRRLKEEEARRKKLREDKKRKEEEASEERRTKLNMGATDNGTLNSNGSSIMKDGSHEEIQKGEVSDMHASAGDQAAFSSDYSDKRDQETE